MAPTFKLLMLLGLVWGVNGVAMSFIPSVFAGAGVESRDASGKSMFVCILESDVAMWESVVHGRITGTRRSNISGLAAFRGE